MLHSGRLFCNHLSPSLPHQLGSHRHQHLVPSPAPSAFLVHFKYFPFYSFSQLTLHKPQSSTFRISVRQRWVSLKQNLHTLGEKGLNIISKNNVLLSPHPFQNVEHLPRYEGLKPHRYVGFLLGKRVVSKNKSMPL